MAVRRSRKTTIRCVESSYFSRHDEDVFYEWLKRIRCISKVYGEGIELMLDVRLSRFTQNDLREFLGVFRRYGLDLAALAVLDHPRNRAWFKDKSKWWFKPIFGRPKRPTPSIRQVLSRM